MRNVGCGGDYRSVSAEVTVVAGSDGSVRVVGLGGGLWGFRIASSQYSSSSNPYGTSLPHAGYVRSPGLTLHKPHYVTPND